MDITIDYRESIAVHYGAKQKIDRSKCYLVLNQTRHCMSACVWLYHVITLNTRTLRVTIVKRKFESKLNSKGTRGPYCEWQTRVEEYQQKYFYIVRGSNWVNLVIFVFTLVKWLSVLHSANETRSKSFLLYLKEVWYKDLKESYES